MTRKTPIPNQPVAAQGPARWIGGTDADPGSDPETFTGIGNTAVTFTRSDMKTLHPTDAPRGALVTIEVYARHTTTDVLWFCYGTFDQARAWPLTKGGYVRRNMHLMGIETFSLKATNAAGDGAPTELLLPWVWAGYESSAPA